MVETLLVMEHLRRAASLKSSDFPRVGAGLPDPAVATANATAAFAELDLYMRVGRGVTIKWQVGCAHEMYFLILHIFVPHKRETKTKHIAKQRHDLIRCYVHDANYYLCVVSHSSLYM